MYCIREKQEAPKSETVHTAEHPGLGVVVVASAVVVGNAIVEVVAAEVSNNEVAAGVVIGAIATTIVVATGTNGFVDDTVVAETGALLSGSGVPTAVDCMSEEEDGLVVKPSAASSAPSPCSLHGQATFRFLQHQSLLSLSQPNCQVAIPL